MESAKKENKNSLDRLFFNKYKPIKKLGEGSFGKIYMAQNINTKEKCALKLVRIKFKFIYFNNIGKKNK